MNAAPRSYRYEAYANALRVKRRECILIICLRGSLFSRLYHISDIKDSKHYYTYVYIYVYIYICLHVCLHIYLSSWRIGSLFKKKTLYLPYLPFIFLCSGRSYLHDLSRNPTAATSLIFRLKTIPGVQESLCLCDAPFDWQKNNFNLKCGWWSKCVL